ncbi:MAG: membrane dipeptidase, partial [Vulcanisaeta sp.]
MSNYPVIDLHEDIAYYLMNAGRLEESNVDFDVDAPNRQSDIPKLTRGNVRIVFGAVFPIHDTYNPAISERLASGYGSQSFKAYTPAASKLMALEMIKVYMTLIRRYSNQLLLIERYSDAEYAINSSKIGLLISMEGADALDDSYDLLLFHRLGVRSLGITWNF